MAVVIGSILGLMIVIFVARRLIKKYSKDNKCLVKRLKNCGKIIFTAWQIATSLPSVMPTNPQPEVYKEAVTIGQVLNGNVIQFLGVGCLTGGAFNYYYQVLSMTSIVIVTCVALYLMGRGRDEEKRERSFNTALTLTYLTLPTITTLLFGMIPCDNLDDGKRYLRADYNINCDDASGILWTIYTSIMIAIFPVGVTYGYSYMLSRNKARIKEPVKEREKDKKLMALAFLFDAYRPKFWYWEIISTIHRLAMTGVLSIIDPDTYTQLGAGLIFAFVYTTTLSIAKPYIAAQDNWLAILAECQLFFVFMSCSFLKYREDVEDPYDSVGMGILLVVTYILLLFAFLTWAVYKKDNMGASARGMAIRVLRGNKRDDYDGEEKPDGKDSMMVEEEEDDGVEMTSINRSSSLFESVNPMARDKARGKGDEGRKGWPGTADLGKNIRRKSNWRKAVDKDGNEYSYDETSGRTTWSDMSQQVARGASLRSSFSDNEDT